MKSNAHKLSNSSTAVTSPHQTSGWNQTYKQCIGLNLLDVVVNSDAYWNNDGMDIVDCKNVQIENCDINTPDDSICLKSKEPRLALR
mmetsp:Transcript_18064/g.26736  ORF Transcript_18064/g.26736 Transcript_18064/m.26736 type:complete len:87 (+) Transcript_18064:130-390(+)